MAENIEQIEAKLAAYVDGELDAAGRAEIEAHLKANPQHRQLIDDLVTQRLALRALPRASAPPEVIERMETHLERSGLLDETPAQVADPSQRIQRWPQRLAMAAIVLLAVGLGGIVYYVIRPPAGLTTTAINGKGLPALSKEGASSTRQAAPPANASDTVQENRSQLSSPAHAPAALATAATQPSALPGERLLFVVATNDPTRANRQIASFLQANQIVTDSPMEGLKTLKTPVFPREAPAVKEKQAQGFKSAALAPSPLAPESDQKMEPAAQEPASGDMQQSVASAATTAPADQSAADRLQAYVQEQSLPAAGEQATTDQARKSDFALQAAPSATAPVAANREVYLARDMTRAQLNALRQSLAGDDSHPTVMVYDQPPIASGTTTGWGGMASHGPAHGQGGQANWSAAATTKPVRDALAPDALAMTTAPSEPLARTWAVPATQPAEPQAKTARTAASQPSDGGLLKRDTDLSRPGNPATNPATVPAPTLAQQNAPLQMQATAPLEEKRDVVILVLKAPAASAENPAAATQPALVPESMPAPATQPTSQPMGPDDSPAR